MANAIRKTAEIIAPRALSVEAAVKKNGLAFGKKDVEAGELKAQLIALLAPLRGKDGKTVLVGCEKTFGALREAWKAGYMSAKGANDAAFRKAWSRYSNPETETVKGNKDKEAAKRGPRARKEEAGPGTANVTKLPDGKAMGLDAPRGGGVIPASAQGVAPNGKRDGDVMRDALIDRGGKLAMIISKAARRKAGDGKYVACFEEPELKELREFLAEMVAYIAGQ